MTTEDERKRAVAWAFDFLGRLCDHRRTKKIPSQVRQEAYAIRRHHPSPLELAGWDGRVIAQRDDPAGLIEPTGSLEMSKEQSPDDRKDP